MTSKYGLIGKNLAHSLSKDIHEALRPIEYELFDIENIESFLNNYPFAGINVTMPYKQTVIPYCTKRDESVNKTRSANTLMRSNNTIHAFNTDYEALMVLLDIHLPRNISPSIAILGNGATAKTIEVALKDLGYPSQMYARHPKDNDLPWNDLIKDKDITTLINATPLGMFPYNDHQSPFDLSIFKNLKWVFDVIYNPLKTPLLIESEHRRIETMNGLPMVLLQAVRSSEHFFKIRYPLQTIEALYKSLLKKQLNIILIGPSFSGKTRIGKMLAEKMDKAFIDTDTLVAHTLNMSIDTIFNTYGESKFRSVELANILKISGFFNHVIATGGGSVALTEAMTSLRQNGLFVHINQDETTVKIPENHTRPLIETTEDWIKLNHLRLPFYQKFRDIYINKSRQSYPELLHQIEVKIDEYLDHQWTKLKLTW